MNPFLALVRLLFRVLDDTDQALTDPTQEEQ